MRGLEVHIKQKFNYLPGRFSATKVQKSPIYIVDTGLQTDMFNVAFCNGPVKPADIDAAISAIKKSGHPVAFWTGFDGDPSWLQEHLKRAGYPAGEDETLMVTNLEFFHFPDGAPLEIRPVTDAKGLSDFLTVMATIIPKKECKEIATFYEAVSKELFLKGAKEHFFVGYDGTKPICCSSNFCHDDIAAIFNVIVDPKYRRRGYGSALTLAAMEDARRRGMGTCHLTATDDAHHLYASIGFNPIKALKVHPIR